MEIAELNSQWKVSAGGDTVAVDLPYDSQIKQPPDYECAMGELNAYRAQQSAVFVKHLPVCNGRTLLEVSGALGLGEVSLDGNVLGTVLGRAPRVFDITGKTGVRSELDIAFTCAPGMSDKYVGMGIGDGVRLIKQNDLDFEYGSIFVRTERDNDKTYAVTSVTVTNNTRAHKKFVLDITVNNARGKRAGKKQRKIFLRAGYSKTFTAKVRIARAYEWTPSDPYKYSVTAAIVDGDQTLGSISTVFGIVERTLNSIRGLFVNGKNTLLMGAYLSHADALLGGASVYVNEKRKLVALKDIGYNAVHYVGCPSEATLDALDDVGMYAFVDIFPCLKSGKAPLDEHILFTDGKTDAEAVVKKLRNHPSVVMYGIADDVPECYNRNDGHAVIAGIADIVKSLDTTRPVTVSAHEFVPTIKELEDAGVRRRPDTDLGKRDAGREKDLFNNLTLGAFDSVDVCGFNYLYPFYESEKLKRNRLIVGARTKSQRAFESVDETEKNGRVIGDFNECGMDYPGGTGEGSGEMYTSIGDIDAIGDSKPQSEYKRILLGQRGVAYITVIDPETEEPQSMWNWPRALGQKLTINVYTSGDVVALYLDGKLIGRRLAGKVNKHIAVFEAEYCPGQLEAVCYSRGVECARATLRSAGSPKCVKLTAIDKALSLSRGDVGFVHIDVCDRDGALVPYAMRELTATVTGATLVAFINADPALRKNSFDTCPAYGGKAIAVIRPDKSEDRAVVKITGDGLLSAKLTFKIKE